MGKSAEVDLLKVLRDAFREISAERSVLTTLWSGSLFIGLFSLIKPFTVQIAINNFTAQGSSQIFSLILFFAFFLLLNVATYLVVGRLEQVFYQWFSRSRAYYCLFHQDKYFKFDRNVDEEVRRRKIHLFLDLSFQNAQQVPVAAATIAPVLIQVAFGLLYIGMIHPFLFAFACLFVATIYFVIAIGSPRALRLAIDYHDAKQDLIFGTANSSSGTKDDLPALARVDISENERQGLVNRLSKKQSDFLRVLSLQSRILIVMVATGNVALLGTGMWLVVNGEMTLGQLVAAEAAFAPALFGALQSSSSFSTVYEVLSNLHLMRGLRQAGKTYGDESAAALLPPPNLPPELISKVPRTERAVMLLGLGTIVGVVLILIYVPWVQTISLEGEVIPMDSAAREHEIESRSEGGLLEIYVKDGEKVKKGQRLAKIGYDKRVDYVLASQDGTIIESLAHSGSSFLEKGDPVFRFLPAYQGRIIRFHLPGDEMHLVEVGDRVVLRFQTWPSIQFSGWPSLATSLFEGRVRSIGKVRGRDEPFYLDVEEAAGVGRWPDERYAGLGAPALGDIQLATVPVGYELWRKINNFPKDYVPARYRKFEKSDSEPR